MKKILSLLLAFTLVFSLGVTAFAEKVPSHTEPTGGGVDDWNYTTPFPPAKEGLELYNGDDKLINAVPEEEITQVPVGEADKLSPEDREAFLAAYEEAKAIEDKTVKYFYWIDVPEKYKTDDFAWAKFEFKCAGENVEVLINGKPVEVIHISGVDYYAKLTEFGALAILVDKVGATDTDDAKGEKVLELYNAEDKLYDQVPWTDVIEVSENEADSLFEADKEAFLAAAEEVKAVADKTVAAFKWLDIPADYKTDEFAWAKYELEDDAENVEVTMNGEPAEVVEDGDSLYAKLPAFGALAVFAD